MIAVQRQMSKVQMPEKKRREKVSGGHFEAGKQAFAMLLLRVGKSWSAVASRCVPEVADSVSILL